MTSTFYTSAQPGKNYTQFDRRKFHFGFLLGTNTSDFRYTFQPTVINGDSIYNVGIKKVPGLNIGIVSSWNIHETVHVRFIPGLSFQEREFTYFDNNSLNGKTTRLESTNLDFPLILKLRTKRINNFAAYALTGAQYSLDLASRHDVDAAFGSDIMLMKQHDFSTIFGGGFDFFMAFYKFAFEIRIANGFKDLLIQKDTYYTAPLTSLKSKVWWFSITFEG